VWHSGVVRRWLLAASMIAALIACGDSKKSAPEQEQAPEPAPAAAPADAAAAVAPTPAPLPDAAIDIEVPELQE